MVAISRPRLSLRVRLLLLTAVALVPALVILVYNEVALRRSREAEVHALALRFGQLASLEMQGVIEGIEGLLLAIAHAPIVRSFDNETCRNYLADVQAQSPHLTAVTVIDLQGAIRCRVDVAGTEQRVEDRPYFKDALATNGFVVGEYTVGRVSGKAALPLATPIRDNNGAVMGVLVAGLDLDWLGRRLRQRDFARGSALTIADRNGVIIAREPLPERFIGTRIPEPFLSLVHAAAPGTQEVTSQDGTRRIIGYVPAAVMQKGLYVSSGISRDEAFLTIDQATRRGIALALVGAAIAFGAAWVFGHRVVGRPVERLVNTIRAWRDGNRAARTGMFAKAGELEAVGAAIDGLMDELAVRQADRERSEARQRLLINELNHRVKNTLTTVQSIASQSLRNAVTAADAKEAIEGRLFALSRAHDVLTRENWEGADVSEIVEQAVAPYSSRGEDRLHLKGPRVRLPPRTALSLAMVLQELATNAVKYGALSNAAGEIRITWDVSHAEPRHIRLRWQESGGPSVQEPNRKGFGSRLIERSLAGDLGGGAHITFAPTGLICTLDAPLA
jgi:two-component sensor histidine kinase